MEKDFALLQDLYNRLTNLSTDWELDSFRSWKGKQGEDYITCKFRKKPKLINPDDMKVMKV